jgi:hypothetical protein
MTQSFTQDRKRVERRHHRMDAELQARARPFSLVRKDTAKDIRELVERQAETEQLDRRLVPGLIGGGGSSSDDSSDSGNGSQRGSGDGSSSSKGGNGSVGGGDSGGSSSTGRGNSGTGSNSGDRSGSGTGTGTGADDTGSSSSSSSSASKTKGIIASLESELHHSSTTSSSSTSTSSTRTTSSSTPTRTSTSSSSTSTSSMTPSTSVAYVTPTSATSVPTLNNAAANATPSNTSSSGPGAGLIIGIVAGSLAGIAVLAALIGFLIKKFSRKDDPYETDPFDSNNFRRQSAMLPDTFDDIDHNPEMSEVNHHNNMGPFNDEMEYAAAGAAGAGAASAFNARNESGGPRPPTMFQNHMNAPAAHFGGGDAPSVPVIGSVFNPNGVDPSPQLPPMAFGGSDPYSMAGVGRSNFDNNLNNPYGHLDRQYSGSRSSPQDKFVDTHQGYADLDRTGSDGSTNGKSAGQMYSGPESNDFRSYNYHDTAGRPGTAEGRSGTPDLPNVQQTYAMADDRETDSRAQSPNRQMVASPAHLSQDFLSNGGSQQHQQYSQQQQYNHDQYDNYQHSESPSPPSQPLQVRNLLPNPHLTVQQNSAHRPVSGVSSVADDEAAYGGVW